MEHGQGERIITALEKIAEHLGQIASIQIESKTILAMRDAREENLARTEAHE
jgi:hypothetical protein